MPNPVVLITGSNSGLGKSLAIQLAQKDYTVYASMRDTSKADELLSAAREAGVDINICQLDVSNPDTICACVSEIFTQESRIDVLVNNAGAGFIRSTEQSTEEEVQWVMDVNFHGVVRCTRAVLPMMREAGGGRIINISSVGGLVGQPFNEIYCAAKFAVEGYTEALACYVQPAFGIKFTSVEPGGISSDFAKNVLAQFSGTGGMREDAYQPILQQYLGAAQARAADSDGIYQSSDEVAEVVVSCIENPDPPIRMRTSDWSERFTALKTVGDPDGKKLQQYVIDTMMS